MILPPKYKIMKTVIGDPARLYYVPLINRIWIKRLSKSLDLLGYGHLTVLEIGFGSGILFSELKKRSEKVSAIDNHLYVDKIKKIFPEIEITKANAEKLPFEKNKFDAIIGISILEHLSNPREAIEETKRILKPGGIAVFAFPIRTKLNDFIFWILTYFQEHEFGDHKFYAQEIKPLLEKYFKIVKEIKIFHNAYQIVKVKKEF